MATSLADAKKGEVVTLSSGKQVVSDGRGGGRVVRKKKKPAAPRVMSNAEAAQKNQAGKQVTQKVSRQPAQRQTTGQILRDRNRLMDELLRQQKGK